MLPVEGSKVVSFAEKRTLPYVIGLSKSLRVWIFFGRDYTYLQLSTEKVYQFRSMSKFHEYTLSLIKQVRE